MNAYYEGKALLDAGEFQQAEQAFRSGLAQNDVRCHYGLLAAAAMQGKDCAAAISGLQSVWDTLTVMAAAQDPDACFILGRCYETGSGVAPDIQLAMKHYTRAASKGNLDAMFNLGCIYMQLGQGGRVIAGDYFREAAEKGHAYARRAWEEFNRDP